MSSPGASAPIDPNVRVPAAVARAAAAADDLHKSAYKPDATPPAPAPAPAPNPAPAPVSAATPPAPAPAPAPAPPIPETGNGDSWERRFQASEGRLRKANETITQQQGTISALEGRLANMEGMMARLQAAPPAPAPSPDVDPKKLLVTKEEIEAYGPDFMDVVARVARQQNGDLLNEIAELKQQLGGVTTHVVQDARERMFTKMDEVLPKWREQNTDPKFLAWLRLPEVYSGVSRQELLKQALAQNNADRVLNFFKGFLAEEATVAPPASAAPSSDGRPSLEDLAAPGRAKSEAVPPSGPSAKPTITRAQIAQFYADVRAGKYKGRDQEKNQAEAEIFAAEREGRIR